MVEQVLIREQAGISMHKVSEIVKAHYFYITFISIWYQCICISQILRKRAQNAEIYNTGNGRVCTGLACTYAIQLVGAV